MKLKLFTSIIFILIAVTLVALVVSKCTDPSNENRQTAPSEMTVLTMKVICRNPEKMEIDDHLKVYLPAGVTYDDLLDGQSLTFSFDENKRLLCINDFIRLKPEEHRVYVLKMLVPVEQYRELTGKEPPKGSIVEEITIEKKLVYKMLEGRALCEVMDSANAGDMGSIHDLIVYYGINYPECDEEYFWIRKGAQLGDEYLQVAHSVLGEMRNDLGLKEEKQIVELDMLQGQALDEVMESAFKGDQDSMKRLAEYYRKNFPDREESTYWAKKRMGNEDHKGQ